LNSSWSKINISVEDVDEEIGNQTLDLHRINQTSLTAQNDLTFIMKQLERVRSKLIMLTRRLSDIEPITEEDLHDDAK